MEEKFRVGDIRGALKEIMEYLETPEPLFRFMDKCNVTREEEVFTHISEKDNIICYFENGAPVVVKHFEFSGKLLSFDIWTEREPYYPVICDDDDNNSKEDIAEVVSPIYQIIKAQRMLAQALRYFCFESKPVRMIIVAPEYKTIFDEPKSFAADCKKLNIELRRDLSALHIDDYAPPYCDFLYGYQWAKSIGVAVYLYKTFRTIDSRFIRAIIDDLHGEFTPSDSYEEECQLTIDDMI